MMEVGGGVSALSVPWQSLQLQGQGFGTTRGGCNHPGCLLLYLHLWDGKQQSAVRAQIPDI